ncbi:MAG: ribose 1,5-bisphosphate isomerase [Candidatus Aenigmarchaeota archaeon]|nr:ribose 1,5-bisphosphate isomerase [Candidatus Aenigmarchaeota archaeon]
MSVYTDIKNLKIQGASEIGKAAIIDLNSYGNHLTKVKDKNEFISEVEKHADKLKSARPTEPLLQNCIESIMSKLRKTKSEEIIKLQKELYMHSKEEVLRLKTNMQKIIEYGVSAIPPHSIILTHCHSHNVVNIITKADPVKVFATETRPRFQGRLTAKDIASAGIETELILDDEVADVIDQVDMVIIGADAITKKGVVNKIGSRMVAEIAFDHKKPVYVAASTLKIIDKIDIEVRDPDEVWKDAPKKVKIKNYAFDTVPYKHIKKIITEKGLKDPKKIKF